MRRLCVWFWRWMYRRAHRRLDALGEVGDGGADYSLRDVLAVERRNAAYDRADALLRLRLLGATPW